MSPVLMKDLRLKNQNQHQQANRQIGLEAKGKTKVRGTGMQPWASAPHIDKVRDHIRVILLL